MDKDIQAYDNYSISTFRECPRKHYYRIERGIIKDGAFALAAEFGIALHKGFETFYSGNMTIDAQDAALLEFTTYYIPIYMSNNGPVIEDKRTPDKGIDLLSKYFTHYKNEPFEVIATEVGGAIELRPDLIYTTRIDLIVQWLSPRGIFGFDHKSTSDMSGLVPKPNNQITGYVANLMEMYEDVLGFQMNLIGVFKTDKQKDRLSGKMVEREIFQRLSTTRNSKEITMWKKEILQTVDFIDRCRDSKIWPRFDKCKPWRNSLCPYHDLCLTQDEDMVEKLIELGAYKYEPWSAYKEEEKED